MTSHPQIRQQPPTLDPASAAVLDKAITTLEKILIVIKPKKGHEIRPEEIPTPIRLDEFLVDIRKTVGRSPGQADSDKTPERTSHANNHTRNRRAPTSSAHHAPNHTGPTKTHHMRNPSQAEPQFTAGRFQRSFKSAERSLDKLAADLESHQPGIIDRPTPRTVRDHLVTLIRKQGESITITNTALDDFRKLRSRGPTYLKTIKPPPPNAASFVADKFFVVQGTLTGLQDAVDRCASDIKNLTLPDQATAAGHPRNPAPPQHSVPVTVRPEASSSAGASAGSSSSSSSSAPPGVNGRSSEQPTDVSPPPGVTHEVWRLLTTPLDPRPDDTPEKKNTIAQRQLPEQPTGSQWSSLKSRLANNDPGAEEALNHLWGSRTFRLAIARSNEHTLNSITVRAADNADNKACSIAAQVITGLSPHPDPHNYHASTDYRNAALQHKAADELLLARIRNEVANQYGAVGKNYEPGWGEAPLSIWPEPPPIKWPGHTPYKSFPPQSLYAEQSFTHLYNHDPQTTTTQHELDELAGRYEKEPAIFINNPGDQSNPGPYDQKSWRDYLNNEFAASRNRK